MKYHKQNNREAVQKCSFMLVMFTTAWIGCSPCDKGSNLIMKISKEVGGSWQLTAPAGAESRLDIGGVDWLVGSMIFTTDEGPTSGKSKLDLNLLKVP